MSGIAPPESMRRAARATGTELAADPVAMDVAARRRPSRFLRTPTRPPRRRSPASGPRRGPRRQSAKRSSSFHGSAAHAATICWARMSSGATGESGGRVDRSGSRIGRRTRRARRGSADRAGPGVPREMPRPADPLEEGRDRAWRSDLTDELDRPDVDPEFEARRRDQRAKSPSRSAVSTRRRRFRDRLP